MSSIIVSRFWNHLLLCILVGYTSLLIQNTAMASSTHSVSIQPCDVDPSSNPTANKLLIIIRGLNTDSDSDTQEWQIIADSVHDIYGAIAFYSYRDDSSIYNSANTGKGGLQAHIDRLRKMIDSCSVQYSQIALIGHSLGGVVALEFIKQQGFYANNRVRHVVAWQAPLNGSKILCRVNDLADWETCPTGVPEYVVALFGDQNKSVTARDLGERWLQQIDLNRDNTIKVKNLRRRGITVYSFKNSIDRVVDLSESGLAYSNVFAVMGKGTKDQFANHSALRSRYSENLQIRSALRSILLEDISPVETAPAPPISSIPLFWEAIKVFDLGFSNGATVSINQSLVKTWRIRNTGTAAWDSSVKLAFRRGKQMGAPNEVNVPATAPNATADVSLNLTAPTEAGEHVGYWQLKRSSTFFGPEFKVQINVRGNAPAPNPSSDITVFDVLPASPSAASSVRLVGRVKQFADFRAMRFVVGTEHFEMSNFKSVGDQFEISADWNTASLARGNYAIALEVARVGDSSWSQPIRQMKSYALTGTPAATNRPPSRPVLKSPYNWFLRDAAGLSAEVSLCVEPASDPEGNAVSYVFDVNNGQVTANGTPLTCWPYTFGPGNYSWRVKTRDSNGAESDWSAETWNFSVANGGVSIGSTYERVLDVGQTQLCAEVTYGGIQAPEVKGFINTATDGSENGEWRQLDHFGPNAEQCNASNVHGFRLFPVDYATGNHAIKISAHKLDSGASAQRTTSFNVPFMRPPGPRAVSPSTLDNNGTQWNTRTIVFDWDPALRADSYTLRASTNPHPFDDPSPVLNQPVNASTTAFTHSFSQDYPILYWSVRATNSAGTGDSAVASFGIDLVQPTCAVQSLPAVHYSIVTVNWSGADNASGVRSYDVQVRDTLRGDWLDWLVDSEMTLSQFLGQPGHSYEFRCRARDRAGNIGTFPANSTVSTRIDLTARPPESWWNASYASKRDISILNAMPATALPVGYPVVYRTSSAAAAAEIYNASQSPTKCDDLRVVYNNTIELDRIVTKCTSTEIEIWFRNQASIPASATSLVHQLYFGNPNAGAPPSQPSAVWQPPPESDTVALYYFQEGSGTQTVDSSGNNRTCTLNNSVQWTSAKFGRGVQFNRFNSGDTRSLTCGPAPALTAFTIDFWYKPDINDNGRIAGALAGGGNGGGGNNWMLSNFEGRIRLDVWPQNDVRSNFNLGDPQYQGIWHHIAVSFNGANEVRFYLDGILDSVKTLSGNGINTFSPPLEIGSVEGIGQIDASMGAFRISNGVKTSFGYGTFASITAEPSVTLGDRVGPPGVGSVDLAVLNVNAYPYANGTMLIEAVVQNQGTLSTRNNFYTNLYLNHVPTGKGDLSNSTQFWVNDSVAPGQIVTLTAVLNTLTLASSAVSVQHASAATEVSGTLYLQADSSNAIAESDISNNVVSSGVEVCVTANDAYEGDDSISSARALVLGSSQTHNFGSPSDQDWARFLISTGSVYALRTSGLDYAADTVLELYSPAGTLLAANDDASDGLSSQLVFTATETGIYYARVRHWNANAGGCGTTYVLSLSQPDLLAPTLNWVVPVTNNGTFSVTSGMIPLQVTATDNISVTQVIFSRWDAVNLAYVLVGADVAAPYEAGLNNGTLVAGWNQINAAAYDAAGNFAEHSILIFRSENGATPGPTPTLAPTLTPLPTLTSTPTPVPTLTPTPTLTVTLTPTITVAPPSKNLYVYMPLLQR